MQGKQRRRLWAALLAVLCAAALILGVLGAVDLGAVRTARAAENGVDVVIEGETDSTNYTTLSAAIEDLGTTESKSATVTLNQNLTEAVTIPANLDVTLDLNGHTLDGTSSGQSQTIQLYGRLTLEDTSTEQAGKIVGTDRGINIEIEGFSLSNDNGNSVDGYATGELVMLSGSVETTVSEGAAIRNMAGKVTIAGGTVTAANNGGSYAVTVLCNGTLDVTGGTIKAECGASSGKEHYGISGNNKRSGVHGTTVNISGGEISGTDVGIYFPGKGELNITGGQISGGTGIEMRDGHLTISGGEVTSTAETLSENTNNNGWDITGAAVAISDYENETDDGYHLTVTITGGTFTASTNCYAFYEKVEKTGGTATTDHPIEISISGGTFIGGIASTNCSYFISGGTFTEDLSSGNYVQSGAEVMTLSYVFTADELAAAAASSGTIILTADINAALVVESGLDITLDLNGHTLTGALYNSSYYTAIRILSGASLTLTDSSDAGTGLVTTSRTDTSYWDYTVVAIGDFVMEGGTIKSDYMALDMEGGTAVMNGGTITTTENDATSAYLVAIFSGSSFTMNGGTILSNYQAIEIYSGTAVMNGGTITSAEGASDTFLVTIFNGSEFTMNDGTILSDYMAIDVDNGTATINGGTVGTKDGTTAHTFIVGVYTNGTLYVNGGTITSNYEALYISGGTATINGGTVGNENTPYGIVVLYDGTLYVTDGEITASGFAISGNHNYATNGTTIWISGGSITSTDGAAIYHPQYGTLIVTGGEITGLTGIEIREGTLYVSGGTITATGKFSESANTGGESIFGAAIAISDYELETHNDHVTVIITGGTFIATDESGYALYEKVENEEDGMETGDHTIEISISDGSFEGNVSSTNCTEFISGGSYTVLPDYTCFAEGYIPAQLPDGSYGVVDGSFVEISEIGINHALTQNEEDSTKYSTTYTGEAVYLFTEAVPTSAVKTKNGYTILDDDGYTDAGEYTVYLILSDGYVWVDNDGNISSDTMLTFTLVIEKAEATVPTVASGWTGDDYNYTATYTGEKIDFFTDTEFTGYTVDLTGATDAGTYTVAVTLDANHTWKEESSDPLTYTFTINKATVSAPTNVTTSYTYTGAEIEFITGGGLYTAEGATSGTNAGEYKVTLVLIDENNYEWATGSTTSYTFTIGKAEAAAPAVDENSGWTGEGYAWTAEYTGSELNFFEAGTGYTVSLAGATDAGEYTVTVTLDSNYAWASGSDATLTYSFTITKAKVTAPEINNFDDYTYDSATGIYTALYSALFFQGDESYTFLSDDNSGLYTIYGNTVEVIEGESMAGIYRVYVILSDTANTCWEDGTNAVLEFIFKIVTEEGMITSPTLLVTKTTVEWAEEITFVVLNDDIQAEYDGRVQIVGNTVNGVGVEDGDTFLVTFHLLNPVTTYWSDLTTGDKTFVFTVVVYGNKIAVVMPDEVTTVFVYETDDNGDAVAQTYYIAESELYEIVGNVQSEAGTYTIAIILYRPDLYAWADKDGNILRDDDGNDLGAVLLYTFTIEKATVEAPADVTTTYTYDGNEITFIEGTSLYVVVGDGAGTGAGKYFVTLELTDPDNYEWAEGSAPMYTFEIEKAKVFAPDSLTTTYTYTGEAIVFVTDGELYTAEGATTGTNAGEYVVTLVLIDPDNYEWADGSATVYDFTIEKAAVTSPSPDATTYTYTGETFTFMTDGELYTAEGATTGTHAGQYVVTLVLNDPANYEWAEGSATTYTFTIEKAKVSSPDATGLTYTYTYSGKEITFIEAESAYYTAQGAMKGTHAGQYVVTLVLNDPADYEWADGATTIFTFTIEQASNSVTDPRISSSGYGIGSAAEFGTVIYRYYLDEDCTEEVTSIVEPGTYYVRAEVEETENYAGAVSNAVEFVVEEDSSVTWADIVGLSSAILLLLVLVIVMVVIIRRKNNA